MRSWWFTALMIGCGASGTPVVVVPSHSPTGEECRVSMGGTEEDSQHRDKIADLCCTDLGGSLKGWKPAHKVFLPICVYAL